jgi:S-adenosylmethionine:tRNA ribosyltransferase-isomerase
MKLTDFDFELPPHLIAQTPANIREQSRLMIVDRSQQKILHTNFYQIIDHLDPNSVLVLNNTKVFNARLFGYKNTGAQIEMFLLKQLTKTSWSCLLRPAKRLNVGDVITIADDFYATVTHKDEYSTLEFSFNGDFFSLLENHGQPPLPPYIKPDDPNSFKDRYQTVFASEQGSVAAPTAGLHFSQDLLNEIQNKGIAIEYITLHVGYGTFKSVSAESISDHKMHHETYIISPETSRNLQKYIAQGKKIVSVGTTSTRTLESAILHSPPFSEGQFESNLFIYPGYNFKAVDSIITNFHLPKSTLLMLVSAFSGVPLIKKAYQEAIEQEYSFYSFGDAMLLC